jgi:hypothetical protein
MGRIYISNEEFERAVFVGTEDRYDLQKNIQEMNGSLSSKQRNEQEYFYRNKERTETAKELLSDLQIINEEQIVLYMSKYDYAFIKQIKTKIENPKEEWITEEQVNKLKFIHDTICIRIEKEGKSLEKRLREEILNKKPKLTFKEKEEIEKKLLDSFPILTQKKNDFTQKKKRKIILE